jgi:hypothetical protein
MELSMLLNDVNEGMNTFQTCFGVNVTHSQDIHGFNNAHQSLQTSATQSETAGVALRLFETVEKHCDDQISMNESANKFVRPSLERAIEPIPLDSRAGITDKRSLSVRWSD